MTCIATLSVLVGAEIVAKYDPEVPVDQMEERVIYMTQKCQEEAASDALAQLAPSWTSEIAPVEQLVALLDDFCAGAELEYDTGFHIVSPHNNGVWELKTSDTRIFGWFYKKDLFIAHRILSTEKVKKYRLYTQLCNDVAHFRDNGLGLDSPNHIPGTDPHAVVSNYHFT